MSAPTKAVRAICYSPEKRRVCKELEDKKIPVTIDNVTFSSKRSKGSDLYIIRKRSHVTLVDISYQFDPKFSQQLFCLSDITYLIIRRLPLNAKSLKKVMVK